MKKPDDLNSGQLGMLHAVAATRGCGHEDTFGNPTLRALERRGLVQLRGSPSLSRRQKWYCTLAGFDRIAAEKPSASSGPLRIITPSKLDPWHGAPAPDGPFTVEQLLELDRRSKSARQVERIVIEREISERELYVAIGNKRPVRRHACPIVGRCKRGSWAGRLAIIAPSGQFLTVNPDGSVPTDPVKPAYGREAW